MSSKKVLGSSRELRSNFMWPRFCKGCPVPYAVHGRIEQELTRLKESKIIERVEFVNWAATIVSVIKPDNTARICGDYKVTVNRVAKLDTYPLPHIFA